MINFGGKEQIMRKQIATASIALLVLLGFGCAAQTPAPPCTGIRWRAPEDKLQVGMAGLVYFLSQEYWDTVEDYRRQFGLSDENFLKVILDVIKRHLQELESKKSQGQSSPEELHGFIRTHCGAIHRLAAHFPRFSLWEIAENCSNTPLPPKTEPESGRLLFEL